ncbi:hypothetical protein K437DRAFT_236633, partial [Tilletiaria anomala UBC 951]
MSAQAQANAFIPPSSMLDRPFLHLYLLVCDDVDHYRTIVKEDIKRWLQTLRSSKGLEMAPQQIRNGGLKIDLLSKSSGASGEARPPVPTKDDVDDVASLDDIEPEFLILLISPQDAAGSGASAATETVMSTHSLSLGEAPSSGSISPGGTSSSSKVGRFYSSLSKSMASVVDKLRQDFNMPPTPGTVSASNQQAEPQQMAGARPRHSVDPTMFADLLNRIKGSVGATLDTFVRRQTAEIARAESTKAPALGMWDFCAWASAREFLARSFEGLQLLEDAWSQYAYVDKEIVSSVQGESHPYFQHLGGLSAGDDSSSVLDASRKPYRELLQRGEISLFDCRCYIFARQASLLSRMSTAAPVAHVALSDASVPHGLTGVMRQAAAFLLGLGRMLAYRQSMPFNYIDAWVYTNALLVVEQCSQWLVERGDATMRLGLSIAFHLAKAELIGIARRQLDKLGIGASMLPRQPPFRDSLPENEVRRQPLPALPPGLKDDEGCGVGVSNVELRKALESEGIFDMQYTALAEREMTAWMTAGKSKNVILLQSILGHLNFARGRYANAYETFTALPDAYGEENWNSVEEDQLVMLLESHERLGKLQDEQWAKSAVMLLRAKALATSQQQDQHTPLLFTPISRQAFRWASEEHLWQSIRQAAEHFAEEQPVTGYPGFVIRPVSSQAEQMPDEDGSTLQVSIESLVTVPVLVDDVRLCLTSAKRDQLWFSSGSIMLNPGRSRIELFCPSPPPGRYVIDVSQVRVAKLIFQEVFGKAAMSTPVPGISGASNHGAAYLVNIPEDGDALYATIALPREVDLDRRRCAELTIESGRNHVETADIGLSLLDGTPLAGLLEAELSEGQTAPLPLSVVEGQNKVQVHGIAKGSAGRILVPLHEASPDGVLRMTITIDYITQQRPEITRHFRRRVDLRIALPLGVNVQDFFRGSSLFSKFSISSGGISTLRIQSAELVGSTDGFDAEAPTASDHSVVTPQQPAVFIFKISRSAAASPEPGQGLRLILRYRTLVEEARGIVLSILDSILNAQSDKMVSTRRNCLTRALGRLIEERLDVVRFAVTGEIFADDFNEYAWNVTCGRWGLAEESEERQSIIDVVRQTLARALENVPLNSGAEPADLPWRTLSIPVDVPQMSIVNSVRLQLSDGPMPFIVGQPRDATLIIKTTFKWGAPPAPPTALEPPAPSLAAGSDSLQLPVNPYDTWLISGEHHGKLSADLSSLDQTREDLPAQEFKIQLIPLRHGSLVLPAVTVKAQAMKLSLLPAAAALGAKEENGHTRWEAQGQGPAATVPSCETFQDNAADRVDVVPRRSRATYWV